MKFLKSWFVAGGLCLLAIGASQAEQFKTLGDWDVHYMVVNSTFFQPDIVRAYGLQRSKFNAIVNVSVLNNSDKKAQSVAVTGTATNLLGTVKKLSFKEVDEGDAIYYVAQLNFRDREKYRFDIDIQRGNQKQKLKFQQEFYVD